MIEIVLLLLMCSFSMFMALALGVAYYVYDQSRKVSTAAEPPLTSGKATLLGTKIKVQLGQDKKEIPVPYAMYPDGVGVVVPQGGGKFLVILPEAENRMAVCNTPFYENLNVAKDLPLVNGLGSGEKPWPWPSSLTPNAGTFWIFGCYKVGGGGKWVFFLHGERHAIGSAPNTYKSILVSYSTDLVNFTTPVPIIECPPFNGTDMTWQGSGDPSFVWDDAKKEFRCYFFSKELGMGLARSRDTEGKPGTWEVWQGGTTFVKAVGATTLKKLPVDAGNPHVLKYNSAAGTTWLMVAGEWGKQELCFAISADGYDWPVVERVPYDEGPANGPLYPSVVNREGGTYYTDKTMRLYWNSTSAGRKFMVRDLTIAIDV